MNMFNKQRYTIYLVPTNNISKATSEVSEGRKCRPAPNLATVGAKPPSFAIVTKTGLKVWRRSQNAISLKISLPELHSALRCTRLKVFSDKNVNKSCAFLFKVVLHSQSYYSK